MIDIQEIEDYDFGDDQRYHAYRIWACHIIGDADHIGNIKDAIHAGYETAKDL